MRRFFLFFLFLVYAHPVFAQREVKGVIADSLTHQPLPFATIRPDNLHKTFISGINGQFSFMIPANTRQVSISYVSYRSRTIAASLLNDTDTIFLASASSILGEVIIRPQTEKIKRIINTAVLNKPLHNPEMYDQYQCNVYYKMKVDLVPADPSTLDSAKLRKLAKAKAKNQKRNEKDKKESAGNSSKSILRGNNHLLFSETYSKRSYKRPQQLQELVLASRFSGLKKTYFTNLVTDYSPFHVYSDYIILYIEEYINPISKGWQQRYQFRLADEISNENDTTFILTFEPKKNTAFNSLKGMVYINSDGYAISHFISSTGDTASDREMRIEQVYSQVNGKWFPSELNFDLRYKQYITPLLGMQMNGRTVIDSVSFTSAGKTRFDKAYPVKLDDSVDLRSDEDWQRMRRDSITAKEKNTYRLMDSLSQKIKLEKIIAGTGKLVVGRLPFGPVDIDVTRLLAFNNYENTRLGLGLYTNEKLSKYFSVGGWAGYGFEDKRTKYGFSATVFPKANKDNWFLFSYSDDYRNAGDIHIHRDIDRYGYRNWLLSKVDRIKEYSITAHVQKDYWEIEIRGAKQKWESLYENNFEAGGKNYAEYDVREAGVGLRYAYGEKRVPFFGYYFPVSTKYPVFYLRSAAGKIEAGDYSAAYVRALAGITYNKHINRWGRDAFQLEAGLIRSFDNKPLSRTFLLAAKGFRRDGSNYYAWGGFLTIRPYDYYSESYVSLLYKHDFDISLWQLKFSKPFISLAHNMLYGGISNTSRAANAGIATPVSGYHESGIIINRIFQINFFHVSNIYLNAGAFYHWTPSFNWKKNGVWVIGVSAGF